VLFQAALEIACFVFVDDIFLGQLVEHAELMRLIADL